MLINARCIISYKFYSTCRNLISVPNVEPTSNDENDQI